MLNQKTKPFGLSVFFPAPYTRNFLHRTPVRTTQFLPLGTHSLHASFSVLGIKSGSEVLRFCFRSICLTDDAHVANVDGVEEERTEREFSAKPEDPGDSDKLHS